MKLSVFIPIGLFTIWYILKYGFMETIINKDITTMITLSLAFSTIVSGIIVAVNYVRGKIKSRSKPDNQ